MVGLLASVGARVVAVAHARKGGDLRNRPSPTVRRLGGPVPWRGAGHCRPVDRSGACPAALESPLVGHGSDAARRATVRDALGLGVAVGLYGAAFGAAAGAAGLDPWQACALSLLMFTGASQFALVGVVGAGGGALAAIGTALLLGTRNTVYGARLVPLLGRAGTGGAGLRRFATAHLVIDESTALALAAPDRANARLAFTVGGATILVGWNLTTLLGALGADALTGGWLAALDAVVPAAFLALVWPRLQRTWREPAAQRRVALGGAALALVLTPVLPAGLQVIAAAAAVALAGGWRRT